MKFLGASGRRCCGPIVCGLFFITIGTAEAVNTWKGPAVGSWDLVSNWAGGLPETNSTVKLDHERQTNAYTVVIQSAAETDKLWFQSFGDVPIHVRVESGGSLNLNMLRMGDKAEDRLSSFTIDGGRVLGQAPSVSITNTSFLVGNNPDGTASLSITNSGSMKLLGSNGLTVASRARSTGRVDVANSALRIKESVVIAQGAGSFGELTLSGTSSVSITGALHIAKLDNGALAPTGHVQVTGGLLECGTLNVGAEGNGTMMLSGGDVRIFGGGITLGKLNSNGLLTMNGGSLTTTGSSLDLGHTDSVGTLEMNGGIISVEGTVSLGSSSRSFGQINLFGGSITANQLTVGAAESSAGECRLLNGELRILGTSPSSLQILNGTVHIEKALLKWANPNVTEVVTNAVAHGTIIWTNGFAAGTYSTNGYDGRIVNGTAALYWDNSDNGSQFGQSAIWVEQLVGASPYDQWSTTYDLDGNEDGFADDPDQDGLNNLMEFGLGGNPTNANDSAILPTFGSDEVSGTNWIEYVYRRRTHPMAWQLEYTLQTCTNLSAGIWSTAEDSEVGTGEALDGFETVTNRMDADAFERLFLKLNIQGL